MSSDEPSGLSDNQPKLLTLLGTKDGLALDSYTALRLVRTLYAAKKLLIVSRNMLLHIIFISQADAASLDPFLSSG